MIEWHEYDHENKPEADKSYLVTNGERVQVSELWGLPNNSLWIDIMFDAEDITHYAVINLPREEEA